MKSYNWTKLAYSKNHGVTWQKANWKFNKQSKLIMPTILNFGKDYQGAKDEYVYSYFIRLASSSSTLTVHVPGKIDLVRVHKSKILNRNDYEFFAGMNNDAPTWTKDSKKRQSVFEDSKGVGWNLSVSYNKSLLKDIS